MSAGITMEDAFGIQTLSDAIETFAKEPCQDLFTNLFKGGRQVKVEGRTHEWDEITRPRTLAPIVGEDSPFKAASLTGRKKKQSPIADVKLYVDIPASRLFRERFAGNLKADAPSLIASELKSLKMQMAKTVEYMCANALLGSLDTSQIQGSELAITLAQTTSTGAQAAAWSTAATKIVSDELPKAVADFIKQTGGAPQQIILNDVAERSLLKNDEIKAWAAYQNGNKALVAKTASQEVFGGLGLQGFEWKKAYGIYTDKNGTSGTRYWPDTKLAFLPPSGDLNDILGFAEGFGAIPKTALGGEGEMIINQAPTSGYYAFAEAISSPVGIRLYAGWAGLPYLVFPGGVYIFTIS